MATPEIIWDKEPKVQTQEIVWDEPAGGDDIVWDDKPKKSILKAMNPLSIGKNILQGVGSGLVKFNTVGKVFKGLGDMYTERADTINEVMNAQITTDAPMFQKRLDLTNKITNLNDLIKNPQLDPVAKEELQTQLNAVSGDITNIDKILKTKYKDSYEPFIKNFNKAKDLEKKALKNKAVGQNLEKIHADVLNKFTTQEDRETFAYQLGSGLESMAEALATNVVLPGSALAKTVGAGLTLSMPGAIDMYDKAVGKGMKPAEARVLGFGNLAINTALEGAAFDMLLKKGGGALLKGFATEGTQELTQTFSDNLMIKNFIDKNQDLTQGLLTSFLVGGIIGGAVGGHQQLSYNRAVNENKEQIKEKYKDKFIQAGMDEPAINKYVDTIAQKAIDSEGLVDQKVLNEDILKMAKTFGKETEADLLKTQPIQGEMDLNNPSQLDLAIREKNKFIVQNENNPAMRNEVALAIQEKENLAEKYQDMVNKQGTELLPAEITNLKAEIKEETGVELTDAQAGAALRQMLDTRTQQVAAQDKIDSSRGGRVNIEGGDQITWDREIQPIPSQRRAELVSQKPSKIKYQNLAEKDLVEGYMEQGGIKIPGDSEYTFLKAQTENSPELYRRSIQNANDEIDAIIKSTDYSSLEEMKDYLQFTGTELAKDPEVKNELQKIESAVSNIERLSERIKSAEQRSGQPAKETVFAKVPPGKSRAAKNDGDTKPKKSFAKVNAKTKEGPQGGVGAKRLDSFIINELAGKLGFTVDAVKNLPGKAIGMAYTDFGLAKLKRDLWKGEFGAVTKEDVSDIEFKALEEAGVIGKDGAINALKYNGKLGQLKEAADLVFEKYGIDAEALNKKLISKRNTDNLSETMAHEIGHLIDAMPNQNIDRGNVIGRLLSGIKSNSVEDIEIIGRNSEIRKELVALTEWWSPYDKKSVSKNYIDYRNSSPELYAEALSVYLNDPKAAKERAPLFFQNFEKHLFRKPGLKEGIEFLDKLRNMNKEALGQYAYEVNKESMDRAENFAKLANEQKSKDETVLKKVGNLTNDVAEELAIGDLNLRRLLKKQGQLNNLLDLTTAKGGDDFLNLSIRKLWISKPKELVARFVNLFGNDFQKYLDVKSDMGTYLIAQRIIHDRSGLANKISPEAAKNMLTTLETKLGEKEYAKLEKDAEVYYQFMDGIMRQMVQYNIMSKEHYDNIKKNNQKYAFFHVAEKEIEKASAAYGDSIPANVKNQVGTLKDVRNPIPSTVDLIHKMGWMMEINRMKIEFVNTLNEIDPKEDVIRKVKPNAKGQMPNADKGYMRLNVLQNSNYTSYDVRKDLFEEYEATIAQLEKLNKTVKWFRPVFNAVKRGVTSYSPGFTLRNPIRDIQDTAFILRTGIVPGTNRSDVKAFMNNLKEGYAIAYDSLKGKAGLENLLFEAENNGAIIPRDLKFALDEAEMNNALSASTEKILANAGVVLNQMKQKSPGARTAADTIIGGIKAPFLKYGELMTNINEVNENAVKLAFYKTLKDKGFSPGDAAVYTRRFAGTPDPTYGGKARLLYGTFLGFFNPTVQGNMRLVHALTRGSSKLSALDKGRFIAGKAFNMALQPEVVVGTILLWALKRLGDDDPEKNPMASVSDATLERYFVLPAFGREIRIPRGQMNQIVHKVTWEVLDGMLHAAKGQGNEAMKDLKAFLGSIFMMSGASFENMTPVLKTLFEAYSNRDWKGNELYDRDNSEHIKSMKIAKHIFRNTFGAPVPKDWFMGFVSEPTGDRERFQNRRINKSKTGLTFETAKADMMTEIAKIYEGKDINPDRLKKLAKTDPELITIAQKAIALASNRKDLVSALKSKRAAAYAREITNIIKGNEGLQGLRELADIKNEAKKLLSETEFKALSEYIGIF